MIWKTINNQERITVVKNRSHGRVRRCNSAGGPDYYNRNYQSGFYDGEQFHHNTENAPFQGICALGIMFRADHRKGGYLGWTCRGLCGNDFPLLHDAPWDALGSGSDYRSCDRRGLRASERTFDRKGRHAGLRCDDRYALHCRGASFLLTAGYPLTDLPYDLGAWGRPGGAWRLMAILDYDRTLYSSGLCVEKRRFGAGTCWQRATARRLRRWQVSRR